MDEKKKWIAYDSTERIKSNFVFTLPLKKDYESLSRE